MTLSRLSFVVLIFLLLPLITAAQEPSEYSKTEVIEKIFEKIPFEGKLNESPKDLHEQFSQNPFGLPPSKNEQMMDLFLKAFTSDSLVIHARKVFNQNYDRKSARAIMEWLERKDTQRVLETENEFYSLQGIRKRVVNRYELEQNPPDDSRTELINTLAASMSTSEAETETQVILFRAIVTAFEALSDQQSFSDSQIDGFVNNFRSRVVTQIDQKLTEQFILRYHGLDGQILQEYRSFYESEAGKWLTETTSKAIQSAYQKASDRFLESVHNL